MIASLSDTFFAGIAEAAAWTPKVGDVVENFGNVGRVLEIDAERGVLLRWMPRQGFAAGDVCWANPEKVRPVA